MKGRIKGVSTVRRDILYSPSTCSGTRHQFMVFENHRLSLPSNREYSVPQLRMIVHEVEAILERSVTADEWDGLA